MNQKSFWRGVLTIVLCVALAAPAQANTSLKTAATEIVVGIVVAAAAVTVLAVVLIQKSKKRAVTGCVNSGESGMVVTDEKDRQVYVLAGNTTGIKSGDRMKLQGKKAKLKSGDNKLVWNVKTVTKDFGVCP